MQIIVVGLNEQGLQRQSIAGSDCVALTSTIQEVPIDTYDAVLICAANENKYSIARYALVNKKHVFLEAPLWGTNLAQIDELEQLSVSNHLVFYVAYSLRFVPEFISILDKLQHKQLGEIYHCRVSYAASEHNKYNGALIDLSPHLLNLLIFWFGTEILQNNFSIAHKDKFGRHVIFADFNARCTIEAEANFFASHDAVAVEIYGSRDNVQFRFAYNDQQRVALAKAEYAHFQYLCNETRPMTDCVLDKWIYAELDRLASEEMLLA